LSKISESEISELSKKTKKDINTDVSCTSRKLIHTVSAACKHVPYMDEAAKEAGTKLFSMWYSLGPPSVFFTISPGDEFSFWIKFYVNLKMDLLPQPTEDDNALIFDSLFRSKIRIDDPGACAREYNAIMQIIMEALIGWVLKSRNKVFLEFLERYLDGVTLPRNREEKHYIPIFFCL
jgi:hypothetical protein